MNSNLIIVAVALAMCLPFIRMLPANPFTDLPTVTTPSR